jgi:20S proteasome subunit beta 4
METLIGVVGADFVLIAADANSARSILVMKNDVEKIRDIDGNKLLAAVGDSADREMFCDYVEKNLALYKFRTSISLSAHASAHWTRRNLATSLRKGPYHCDLLIAGFDPANPGSKTTHSTIPSLYYIDYLASMNRLDFGAHGYGSNFVLSIFDRYYKPGMSVEEVLQLLRTCLNELKTRFIIKEPLFTVKIVDRNGVRSLDPIQV